MFSLENFYYILYTNLFKPARTAIFYFSPFGSTDPNNLIKISENYPYRRVAYFYDQEPLLKENLQTLEATREIGVLINEYKHPVFFITSEHSDLKKEFCKTNQLVDLYYFFHGFAALYWYQDYKYFNVEYPIKKHYMCLNHIVINDRSYRLQLIGHLIEKNILSKGIVSLHSDNENCRTELKNPNTKLSDQGRHLVQNMLATINLPLIADTNDARGSLSADAGPEEYEFYQSVLWHIVTETVFYYPKLHLTEKIFKPIATKRAFILVAAPGNLAYLKRYGFKTFDNWIDESYDQEADNDKRLEMITREIEKLSNLTIDQIREMHAEMQEILEFNFLHFYGDFKKIIIDELLENFKYSAIAWNNGRVDDRIIDIQSIKFNQIRKLLLS